jgi:UDP-N-acetylglucosamine 1-carboxyvinyltransferase
MDKIIVEGPCKLNGEVEISGAKNAALPIICGALLTPQKILFNKLPQLHDIKSITKLLENLGAKVNVDGDITSIQCDDISSKVADYDLVRKMRASILVLGPLLARYHEAKVSLPGGCAIGARPVDLHLSGMEALGATINIEGGYVYAKCDGLKGSQIDLDFPSVGATENIMMAACLAEGETIIENAAKEPEIIDLGDFLNALGFEVSGHGTRVITIKGKSISELENKEVPYQVIGDRIEAATYLIGGVITNGEVTLKGIRPEYLNAITQDLEEMGCRFEYGDDWIKTHKHDFKLNGAHIETEVYPGFPTDAQAQMMVLMSILNQKSSMTETIFENRFMHVPEMVRMGAEIELKGNTAFITGSTLKGAPVMCTDLRASAALILCGLVAEGETTISRVYHLDRGYEHIEEKLSNLGAKIKRV